MQKLVLFLVIVGVMFVGCTKKNEVDLNPYITLNQNDKQSMKINFLGVTDKRETKSIAVVLEDGVEVQRYGLSNNIKQWYEEAVKRELKNSEMFTTTQEMKSLLIHIKKIEATYNNDKLDKKNMQVSILLELIIKEKDTTTKSNITINQTAYKMIVSDASDFDAILNESIRSSVSKAVAVVIEKVSR